MGQRRRLTDKQAVEARKRHADGETITALAADYGIQRSSMGKLLSGYTYVSTWQPNKPKTKGNQRRLTNEEVYNARLRARLGESITSLAHDYDLNHSGMSKIVRGIHYKNAPGPIIAAKPREKLGKIAALNMRLERARTFATCRELAKKYGCHESEVSLILRGKRYPDAGGPIWERLI